jgi:hypothetical protein
VTKLENIETVTFLEVFNPFAIRLFDVGMCETLTSEEMYSVVDELIIGLVVVFVSVVDCNEDLCKIGPLFSQFHVSDGQVYAHFQDSVG